MPSQSSRCPPMHVITWDTLTYHLLELRGQKRRRLVLISAQPRCSIGFATFATFISPTGSFDGGPSHVLLRATTALFSWTYHLIHGMINHVLLRATTAFFKDYATHLWRVRARLTMCYDSTSIGSAPYAFTDEEDIRDFHRCMTYDRNALRMAPCDCGLTCFTRHVLYETRLFMCAALVCTRITYASTRVEA